MDTEGTILRRVKRAARAVLIAFEKEDRPLSIEVERLLEKLPKLIEATEAYERERRDEAV